jgi:hypothetical protein
MLYYMVTKAQKEMVKQRSLKMEATKPEVGEKRKRRRHVYAHTMEQDISVPLLAAEKWGPKFTTKEQIDLYIRDWVSMLKRELTLEEGSSDEDDDDKNDDKEIA